MSLKEKIAKKILELKLNSATKHMKGAIQQLQQKYDELVKETQEEEK